MVRITLAVCTLLLAPAAIAQDMFLSERLATVPKTSPWPMTWFQPRETVRGESGAKPLLASKDGTLSSQAIRDVIAYGDAHSVQGVMIWRNGKTELVHYATGFDPGASFNSYHMHWLPLVLAVGIAVGDGKLDLDAPLATLLPEWAGDGRGKITPRHLLTMTAGLQLYHDSTKPEDLAAQIFFGGYREKAVLAWPQTQAAGSTFEYNYVVPELLGLVLERATGRRYADYLSERLWNPLGNSDAEVWLDRPDGLPYHNAALFARARDWLNLGILIAQNGTWRGRQIVPASWFAEMRRGTAANPSFGFTWLGTPFTPERRFSPQINYSALASEPYAAPDVLIVDGYVHRLFVVPSRKLVVFVAGMSGRMTAERKAAWDDSYIVNRLLK
jgi:hypothetical protein